MSVREVKYVTAFLTLENQSLKVALDERESSTVRVYLSVRFLKLGYIFHK